jgi:hypothetical protein
VDRGEKELRVVATRCTADEHEDTSDGTKTARTHRGTLKKYICKKSEAFTVQKVYIEVYRAVTNVLQESAASIFCTEDGGSMPFRKV